MISRSSAASDCEQWGERCAARLRLVQSSCAGADEPTRHRLLSEELAAQVEPIPAQDRGVHLEALARHFPDMGKGGDGGGGGHEQCLPKHLEAVIQWLVSGEGLRRRTREERAAYARRLMQSGQFEEMLLPAEFSPVMEWLTLFATQCSESERQEAARQCFGLFGLPLEDIDLVAQEVATQAAKLTPLAKQELAGRLRQLCECLPPKSRPPGESGRTPAPGPESRERAALEVTRTLIRELDQAVWMWWRVLNDGAIQNDLTSALDAYLRGDQGLSAKDLKRRADFTQVLIIALMDFISPTTRGLHQHLQDTISPESIQRQTAGGTGMFGGGQYKNLWECFEREFKDQYGSRDHLEKIVKDCHRESVTGIVNRVPSI